MIAIKNATEHTNPVEADLLKRCLEGDRKAQLLLYERCFGLLMSMARRYYRNREDCAMHVNTAFLKILSRLAHYKGEGSFEGWCRRIMTNTLIDEWRKTKQNHNMSQDDHRNIAHDLDEATYNTAESKLAEEDVLELLFHLPAATRNVFNLFAIEGYSHAEIAGMVSISEGTSRWHVNEARRQLKLLIVKKIDPRI